MTGGLSNNETARGLRENIAFIRREIGLAAPGREVTLLGATKTVPPEVINLAARECGLTDIGENRVQELLEKYPSLDLERINIHFIGRLQKNKVKYLIGKVRLIHSVDSASLAGEINRRSEAAGLVTDVLAEINSGCEEDKGGIDAARIDEFLASLSGLKCVRVRGLMTVAPACSDPEGCIPYFKLTKALYDKYFGAEGDILSMGMSDSYRQAVRCGSNLVRVGSAIFGKRNPAAQGAVRG